MEAHATPLLQDLAGFVGRYGVRVDRREMDIEKPGEFDGPRITLNPRHAPDALGYYLAHAFGSIAQWSLEFARARQVFLDLRRAAADRGRASEVEFERALGAWRRFEEQSSEHAVWLLQEVGWASAVLPYTVFFRADLEAMTIFHRTGKEPRWPDFFAEWQRRLAAGDVVLQPFEPRPVPPFQPVKIETQEVQQERD